jgi:hypothetical protein
MTTQIISMLLLNKPLFEIAAYIADTCPNATSSHIAMLIGMAQDWLKTELQ